MDLRITKQGRRTEAAQFVPVGPNGTVDALGRSEVTAYWASVNSILREVFQREDADALVRRVRRRLRKLGPSSSHALFYHASPLHVAADLVGIEGPLSEAQESRAMEIQGTGLA